MGQPIQQPECGAHSAGIENPRSVGFILIGSGCGAAAPANDSARPKALSLATMPSSRPQDSP